MEMTRVHVRFAQVAIVCLRVGTNDAELASRCDTFVGYTRWHHNDVSRHECNLWPTVSTKTDPYFTTIDTQHFV